MILFRGGINTYETLDLSGLHLKGLSVVHPMPSKIPVNCWSVKTTNHLSQTFRAKIFLWESFKTSITSSHKTIEKERRLKTYSLQQKGQNLKRASANPSTSDIFKWLSQFKSLTSKAEVRSFPNTSKGGRENIKRPKSSQLPPLFRGQKAWKSILNTYSKA